MDRSLNLFLNGFIVKGSNGEYDKYLGVEENNWPLNEDNANGDIDNLIQYFEENIDLHKIPPISFS